MTTIIEAVAWLGCKVTIIGHSLSALSVAIAAEYVRAEGVVLLAPSPPAKLLEAVRVPPLSEGAPVTPPPFQEAVKRYFAGRTFNRIDVFYRM